MYSEEDLASAVRAGVLTDGTASAFREHVASISQAPADDEERFRLVTGFNDIFVVIACVLMLLSLAWIGSVAFAPWVGAVAIGAILILVVSAIPQALEFKAAIACVSGAALFALAMRWDSMDTLRRSRRSDVAFWLHLSALGYVLYTFTDLLKQHGMVSLSFAVTALAIGSALLLLSAFWHPSRAVVVRRLRPGLRAWLPEFR